MSNFEEEKKESFIYKESQMTYEWVNNPEGNKFCLYDKPKLHNANHDYITTAKE